MYSRSENEAIYDDDSVLYWGPGAIWIRNDCAYHDDDDDR
jgi:hypothetical protein